MAVRLTSIDIFSRLIVFVCDICPLNHYSLAASTSADQISNDVRCHRCPPGGICNLGIITAKENFWGYRKQFREIRPDCCLRYREVKVDVIRFVQLPLGYGCRGTKCVDYNSCEVNRMGRLCAQCHEGYSESMVSTKCIPNEECYSKTFWVLAVVLCVVYLIFFCL